MKAKRMPWILIIQTYMVQSLCSMILRIAAFALILKKHLI